jgi:hypothetical protein
MSTTSLNLIVLGSALVGCGMLWLDARQRKREAVVVERAIRDMHTCKLNLHAVEQLRAIVRRSHRDLLDLIDMWIVSHTMTIWSNGMIRETDMLPWVLEAWRRRKHLISLTDFEQRLTEHREGRLKESDLVRTINLIWMCYYGSMKKPDYAVIVAGIAERGRTIPESVREHAVSTYTHNTGARVWSAGRTLSVDESAFVLDSSESNGSLSAFTAPLNTAGAHESAVMGGARGSSDTESDDDTIEPQTPDREFQTFDDHTIPPVNPHTGVPEPRVIYGMMLSESALQEFLQLATPALQHS